MVQARSRRPLIAPFVVLSLAVAMSAGAGWTSAQEGAPHPAHIHSGTCDNLGDIVAPLTDVQLKTAGESFGATTAIPVEESETDVPLTLNDILSAPHAINIHESADAIQNYIACGDIGGRVVDGRLPIGLRELNGSGYSGVATLEDADAETNVMVFLAMDQAAENGEAETPGAPAAAETPAAETPAPAAETPAAAAETEAPAAAAQEVPVDIRDFLFSPDPIEVPAGGTVTWTNQGAVPHTATATERDVLQSGAISPGASFSQEFPTAGEFSYFCEFHPNMTGTIVVE